MNLPFLGTSALAWLVLFSISVISGNFFCSAQIRDKHLSAHPITRDHPICPSVPPWWICPMAHKQKRQPRFELPFLPTKERPQSALEKMEKIIYCTFTFSVSR
jgi:hypothetical protein